MKIEPYRLIIGNATDTGKVRSCNEDYLAHFDTPYGYCVIVCDGMGGHSAGDIASREATEAIRHYLQDGNLTKLETPSSLLNAFEFANYKLRQMVKQDPRLTGMGTTCILALFHRSEFFIAHAGDSRLYLVRNNSIKQLTKDHSAVQNMIDAGIMTEEEAKHSNKKNQITKAIGIFDRVEPAISKHSIRLRHDDRFLLCSDGLTTHVDDKEILKILKTSQDCQDAATNLVGKANANGGTDNITVQVVEYYGKSASKEIKGKRFKKVILILAALLIIATVGYFAYRFFFGSGIKMNPETIIPVQETLTDTLEISDNP